MSSNGLDTHWCYRDIVDVVEQAGEHVDAIKRDGLRVIGPIAEFTVRVPALIPQTVSGSWDTIVLATKAPVMT